VKPGAPPAPTLSLQAPEGASTLGRRDVFRLGIAALGVVYGDIGTSPLYALRQCFSGGGLALDQASILGVLSLVFWSLTLVVVVKYLSFVLRADNDGEGGIMALLALLLPRGAPASVRRFSRPRLILTLGLLGTGLIVADGVITPAVSVLGAVEGLEKADESLRPLILPLSILILTILFAVQKHGSGRIGAVFGPLMLIWFVSIFVLGLPWIAKAPQVLLALNPLWAVDLILNHDADVVLPLLGAVVLCFTGAEALYADMGHFGRTPIRMAWYVVAFPALLVNYFGQGALLLEHPEVIENPFYALVPGTVIYPLVGIATMAAIIASQALISGVFSLAMQAVHLGYLPRLEIRHTSVQTYGQVYVPQVNWLLMVGCIGAVLGFRETGSLTDAYGIAVMGAMLLTTLLLFGVMRKVWGWSWVRAGSLTLLFLAAEIPFLVGGLTKVENGGWFPIAVGLFLYAVMSTWRRGRFALSAAEGGELPLEAFVQDVERFKPLRVGGNAVFLTSKPGIVPKVLLHHYKHSRVLHEQVVALTLLPADVPRVDESLGVEVKSLGQGFFRVEAQYGFLQTPDVPRILQTCAQKEPRLSASEPSYFLGRDTLIVTPRPGLAAWRKRLFVYLSRNARPANAFFRIPPNRVVELGGQIEI
jgi:KUP system potassium uptake protein